jgi:transposase
MSGPFIKGVKENLSRTKITFDRCDIIELLNKAVNEVRRDEVLSNSLPKGNMVYFLKK